MKTILLAVTCLLMLVALAMLTAADVGRSDNAAHPPEPGPPSINMIRERADLVALETELSCVVDAGLTGYTGAVRALVVAYGRVTFASDLSGATWRSVDHDDRVATLSLPPPRPRQVALDHEQTEIWSVDRRGLWSVLPQSVREGDAITHALRSAERTMRQTAQADPNLHAQARQHARDVIATLYKEVGWTIEVTWQAPADE